MANVVIPQPIIRGQTERFIALRRTDGRIAILDNDLQPGFRTVLHVADVAAAELALKRLVAGALT